jgi:hypothetical protein
MIIERIKVEKGAVLPTAPYANMRVVFSAEAILEEGDNAEKAFLELSELPDQELRRAKLKAESENFKEQNQNFRFYERDGFQYVSCTTILSDGKDFFMPPYELKQHASVGNIYHKLFYLMLMDKKWFTPEDVPELEEDLAIVRTGSLHLEIDCEPMKALYEAIKDDLGDPVAIEKTVYNDEIRVAGTYDLKIPYQGKMTLVDLKKSVGDFRQNAFYAVSDPDKNIAQLAIFKLGSTENKCGYTKPKVTTDITGNYQDFLKVRWKFYERWGV